jgi:hypothetical protein
MRPSHLTLIAGGGSPLPTDRPSLARATLHVIQGGASPEVERALADAVETARAMRVEIERRIAEALEDERH